MLSCSIFRRDRPQTCLHSLGRSARTLSADVSEHFVGIKEIGRIAAVALEGLHQGWETSSIEVNKIAKAFLDSGRKVDAVKFPHRLIIQSIKPFSRSAVLQSSIRLPARAV